MEETNPAKKYWKQIFVGAVVFVFVVAALIYCSGDAKAAEPANDDAWRNLQLPLTVGYLAGNPAYGAGLGYTFPQSRITIMGQIIHTEIDGEHFTLHPFPQLPTVPFNSPKRDETGFQFTVILPFWKH